MGPEFADPGDTSAHQNVGARAGLRDPIDSSDAASRAQVKIGDQKVWHAFQRGLNGACLGRFDGANLMPQITEDAFEHLSNHLVVFCNKDF